MSSHREAPEISKDPVADSTDVYAFVSPDKPDTVTLISNYIPLQGPAGGPNFYEFGDDVLYEIHIDNDGDARPDITYQFRFTTKVRNPNTFLYNTGPITTLDDADWNRRQFYSVTKAVEGREPKVLATRVPCPPCNIGPRSTPDFAGLAAAATVKLPSGERVYAGQRAEGFYVDLGSIFDLGALRPFQNLHLIPLSAAAGVNATANINVHTIAIQVPITDLTRGGTHPRDPADAKATIGVYASASRRRVLVREDDTDTGIGPHVQVSRLGNPLFNEVIVPMGQKDVWNACEPAGDKNFVPFVERPELAGLLPVLYPGVFPNLAALSAPRADLVAILLTGIPSGMIPGFQNFTGTKPADLLRLNTAISPASNPSVFGLLGGDLAGFPNGRRVFDDVVAIELRAIAGATYPLVDGSFTPDAAASAVDDGVGPDDVGMPYLDRFPYLGLPHGGFDVPAAA
ncbi:MAG TPA: DUF4331 domain-containing protein [Jiangellaceae bacterium]|nr:DUF4331 domain-containing protein [Jiangellaceae bacterium]